MAKTTQKAAQKPAQLAKKAKKFVDSYACEIPAAKKAKKIESKTNSNATRVVIKCNCGYPNNLFLRGEGIPGISWERGVQMKNLKPDEWVWETNHSFKKAEIKIVLNDRVYEQGQNHVVEAGKTISFEPHF